MAALHHLLAALAVSCAALRAARRPAARLPPGRPARAAAPHAPRAPPNATLYFHHLAKAAGTAYARELLGTLAPAGCRRTKSGRACRAAAGDLAGGGCELVTCENGGLRARLDRLRAALPPAREVRVVLLLREPAAHVRSMWAHCQQEGAEGLRAHGYARIGWADWLRAWAALADAEDAAAPPRPPRPPSAAARALTARYCKWDPRDIQTAELGGAAGLGGAHRALHRAWAVGVAERFGDSLCALQARLGAPRAACECGARFASVAHSTCTAAVRVSARDAARVARLTARDARLHAHAGRALDAALAQLGLRPKRARCAAAADGAVDRRLPPTGGRAARSGCDRLLAHNRTAAAGGGG